MLLVATVALHSGPPPHPAAGLRQCMKDLGLRRGWLVSSGRERRLLSPDIEIIPWAEIASGYFEA